MDRRLLQSRINAASAQGWNARRSRLQAEYDRRFGSSRSGGSGGVGPQPPGLTEELINQEQRRGIADVGDLRFNFGQEGQNMMDAARARAQSAFGTAAVAQNQLGGSAGAARRALLMAQGATAGEDAVNSVRDQLQQRDLQAQGIRLQDVAAEAESRLGIDRFRESQRQFDLELERQRESARELARLELEKIRLAAQMAIEQERASYEAARKDDEERSRYNSTPSFSGPSGTPNPYGRNKIPRRRGAALFAH